MPSRGRTQVIFHSHSSNYYSCNYLQATRWSSCNLTQFTEEHSEYLVPSSPCHIKSLIFLKSYKKVFYHNNLWLTLLPVFCGPHHPKRSCEPRGKSQREYSSFSLSSLPVKANKTTILTNCVFILLSGAITAQWVFKNTISHFIIIKISLW